MKNTRAFVIATLLAFTVPCSSAWAVTANPQAWLKPTSDAWQVKPLLNVGDAVGAKNYRMVVWVH
jgi:hypothetical protein